MSRRNAVVAVVLLALGLAGVALAGVAHSGANGSGTELKVSVSDGRVSFTAATLPAGKVTLVVVNKGTKRHALAIMGETMSPKRTATIAVGKTARLTVTLAAGKYHMWDPVTSSMSHARFITVKAAPAGSGGGTGSTGSTGSGGTSGGGTGSTGGTGGGGGGTTDPGMDGCDHM